MNFNNQETQDLFDLWINLFPETFHPSDMERFYDFIYSMFKNEEFISEDNLIRVLIDRKGWENKFARDQASRFVDVIENTIQVLRYLRDRNLLA